MGTLDESAKSRLHISLHYQQLSSAAARHVLRFYLRRFRDTDIKIEAEEILDFVKFSHREGVGWTRSAREIGNVVTMALALAMHSSHKSQKVVNVSHFELVAKEHTTFDQYLTQTRGGTDEDIAAMCQLRRDELKAEARPRRAMRSYTSENSDFDREED